MGMTARRYERIVRLLGLTKDEVCAWLDVNRVTEWRWRQNGPPKAIAECLRMKMELEHIKRISKRSDDRVRTHASESSRGGFPDALVRPRKRKGKAELRAEAERLITKE